MKGWLDLFSDKTRLFLKGQHLWYRISVVYWCVPKHMSKMHGWSLTGWNIALVVVLRCIPQVASCAPVRGLSHFGRSLVRLRRSCNASEERAAAWSRAYCAWRLERRCIGRSRPVACANTMLRVREWLAVESMRDRVTHGAIQSRVRSLPCKFQRIV